MFDNISLIVAASILLGIFVFCLWVIKRRLIDKKYFGAGTEFVSRQVYSQYQMGEKQDAIEHIDFMEEDERDEDRGAATQ